MAPAPPLPQAADDGPAHAAAAPAAAAPASNNAHPPPSPPPDGEGEEGLDIEDVLYSANSFWAVLKPVALTMFLAALVVGNLLVILAFVSALSVPWVTQVLPALFYYRWRQRLAAASASSALGGPGGPGGGGNWGFFSSLSSLTDDGPASSLLLPPPLTSLWPAGGGVAASAASAASWLLPRGGRVAPLSRKEKAVVCLVGGVGVLNFLVCAGAAVGKVAIKELRGETVIGCGSWTVYSDAG